MRAMETQTHPAAKPEVSTLGEHGAVSAAALLRQRSVRVIEHAGVRYQLRLTRNGKLILTK